jgi:hypothetical protein
MGISCHVQVVTSRALVKAKANIQATPAQLDRAAAAVR